MNSVIDDSVALTSSQTAARKGLGLETTNQRSVSSVLTKTSGINPQQIADAGQQVRRKHNHLMHRPHCVPADLPVRSVMTVQLYTCKLLQLYA